MKGFTRHLSNRRGFTLLEILLAAGLLLGAVVYLTRIYYGVGSISADSRLQMEQIIIAQSAMEIVMAGILDEENLRKFKEDDIVEKDITIYGPDDNPLGAESGFAVVVVVYTDPTDYETTDLTDFMIVVTAKHPQLRDFTLTHHLLGV
jgi:type II secretory pathway component PulJ